MSQTTTLAPSSAISSAMPRPMPRAAPVTMATLPETISEAISCPIRLCSALLRRAPSLGKLQVSVQVSVGEPAWRVNRPRRRSLVRSSAALVAGPAAPHVARRKGHREAHHQKTRQVVCAHIDRIEMQGERQQHHGVLRARRKRDHDIGQPERQERHHDEREQAATMVATANEPSAAPR